MVLKVSVVWRAHLLLQSTSLLVVDVLERTSKGLPTGFREEHINASSSEVGQSFLEQLGRSDSWIRFLLPTVGGYLIQSDFLSRRLVDCKDVVEVRKFSSLNQHFEAISIETCKTLNLTNMLKYSVGAMVISSQAWSESQSADMDEELNRRFSFQWHSSKPRQKTRLAIIRPCPTSNPRSLEKLADLAQIATSLNIELVLFDKPGHELANSEWSHLRQDFVGLDLTLTDDLPERIAAAVSAYAKPFDGIMATYEGLLTAVAQAATLLGLPTSSPDAYTEARNKYKTRLHDQSLFVHCLKTMLELEKFLAGYRTVAPTMPLIVKPSDGWASEGVCKVKSEEELRDAVTRLLQPSFSKYGRDTQCSVVVEPYVDGPEVDVNMVLIDGDLVFFEINDDFPSSGDGGIYDGGGAGFVETLNALPSSLPENEIELIRSKAHKIVLDMGFRTGVYHVEARVHNSAFDHIKGEDGIVDLVAKPKVSDVAKPLAPAVYVLEVNARAPGGRIAGATNRSYGVSYRALAMLAALGDHERMRALSTPFLGGAQYHMQAIYISARKGGVYQHGDVFATMFDREPNLRDHLMDYLCFLKNGDVVPDSRTIALCLVASRKSRRDAHATSKRIQHLAWEITGGF